MGTSLLDVFSGEFAADRKVSIVEFCESDEFCNKPLFPRQRVLLKTLWLEELEGWEEDILSEWIRSTEQGGEVRICNGVRERRQFLIDNGYKHFREIILVGGRRSSKGWITAICIAKKLYDFIQLKNPQKHYNVDPDKQLYATIIAASQDQAKAYQFADLVGAVTSCSALEPFFNKFNENSFSLYTPADFERQKKLQRTRAKIERDFASLIATPKPANAGTIRGEATFVVALDEMAHMLEGVNSKSSAEKVYKAITPALDQIGKDSMIFENSSPYTEIGQFFTNYQQGMPCQDDGTIIDTIIDHRMFVFQYPSWELYRGWERDPQRRFAKAIIVSPDDPPSPYMTSEQAEAHLQMAKAMKLEEEKDPDTFRVERRAQFAKVIDSFLDPDKVDQIFQPWDGRVISERDTRSGYGAEVKFAAHADPSTTTANFGFCVGHMEWGLDRDGNEVPHVVIDKIHAWIPADYPDRTINYLEVQDQLVDWAYNFRPERFSLDQFNSRAIIQYLTRELRAKKAGEVRVVEKTATQKSNYNTAHVFKTAINLNLVHAPADSPFAELAKNEMKFLMEKNGRVDKQTIGPIQTKDVFDCISSVVEYLIGNWLSNDPPEKVAVGGQRGYQITENRLGEGYSHPSEMYNRRERLKAKQRRVPQPLARGTFGKRRFK